MSADTDMLMQNYLEVLLNSKVVLRLVRTLLLHPGRIFTIRKLASAAGVSTSEAAVITRELERYGVLTIQPVGRSYLVSTNNRSYVLNKVLKPLIRAEDQTLEELISILRKHLSGKGAVICAALFGSVARGQAREDSDIDLLVISDDFDAAVAAISEAQEEVASVFNSRLSPLIISKKELKVRVRSRLFGSVKEDYLQVAGKDLQDLVEDR